MNITPINEIKRLGENNEGKIKSAIGLGYQRFCEDHNRPYNEDVRDYLVNLFGTLITTTELRTVRGGLDEPGTFFTINVEPYKKIIGTSTLKVTAYKLRTTNQITKTQITINFSE